MSDRSPQNQDKFVVRLPDGMRDRIKAAAEANNRSMNAEIVATLEDKYPVRTRLNRLQAVMFMCDDTIQDLTMSQREQYSELAQLKDIALKIISKMTRDEFQKARRELWYPGELDMFEDWPPQGWNPRSSTTSRYDTGDNETP